MLSKDLHSSNEFGAIEIYFGITISCNASQYSKTLFPILVTEGGMCMEINDRHFLNAPSLISTRDDFGNVIENNDEQTSNVPSSMVVIPSGKTMERKR